MFHIMFLDNVIDKHCVTSWKMSVLQINLIFINKIYDFRSIKIYPHSPLHKLLETEKAIPKNLVSATQNSLTKLMKNVS